MKKHYLASLLLFICAQNIEATPYSWKQKPNFGGVIRNGSFGFSIESLGYIGGGNNGTLYNDFWAFDPLVNSWTQKNNMPASISAASSFVIDGKGYVIGGVKVSGPINKTLYMYDPVTNTWTTKATYPATGLYGAAAFAVGSKGYFGVGNAGGYTSNAWYEYDALNDTWSQKTSFPGAQRFGTYGISLNGYGYVGFGGDATIATSFSDWWQYDPLMDSWATRASLPAAGRDYPTGFTIGNYIYIGTGDYYAVIPYKDLYEYDPIGNTWTAKQNYGGVAHTIGIGFSIGNKGYFGMGYDYSNSLNEFWEYSPDTIATGIIAEDLNSEILLFPNPANHQLTVKMLPIFKNAELYIYDISGKKVIQQVLTSDNQPISIDINGLINGVYFLSVNVDGHLITRKFLKE